MIITRENRPKFIAVGFGLAITALHFVWWGMGPDSFLGELRTRLDGLVYDTRMKATLDTTRRANDLIAIVDLDEKSLAEQGRWPWPRVRFAELLEGIVEAGAVVVALDIMFPDADTNPVDLIFEAGVAQDQALGEELRESLEALRTPLDGDLAMAAILRDNDIVVGFAFNNEVGDRESLPQPSQILNDLRLQNHPIPSRDGILANVAVINAAARYQGFFSTSEDADGVLRRYQLFNLYRGVPYASLSVEAVRVFTLLDGMQILEDSNGNLERVMVGPLEIPADNTASTLIPFLGPQGMVNTYSATDVLMGRLRPGELEGKIVFVGSTAQASSDFIATPVQANYPGLEVHATLASAILDQNWKIRNGMINALGGVFVIFVGLLMSIALPFLRPLLAIVAALGLLALVVVGNIWLWSGHGIDLDLAIAVILAVVLTIFNVAYGFVSESAAKQEITGMFGQYVPPDLVKQMGDRPDLALSFDGDRREMTVLFADVRNFTSISEGLEPGALKDMLNRYFTPMTRIIFEQQGTIDKYIGDMIMAFWGAPLEDADHASHAVAAALEMLRVTAELRPEFKARGYPDIRIGVGLNSGDMSVGNMGSEYRRAYTVLGDNVNLGSRIEGLTKFYGLDTMVGEHTRNLTRDKFVYRLIDKVLVKGKEEPVCLYEPLGLKGEVSDKVLEELAEYDAALADYFAGEWKRANAKFTSLMFAHQKTLLYRLYRDRVAVSDNPEPGWDGVYRHTSK